MAKRKAQLPVVIVGTGPEARQVADTLEALGLVVYGYLQPERTGTGSPEPINDIPVLGALTDPAYRKMLAAEQLDYVIAQADGAVRKKFAADLFALTSRHPYTLVHPSASVAPSAQLLAGCYVGPQAVVGPNAQLGTLVWVGPQAGIAPDAQVADYATLGPAAQVGPGAQLAEFVLLGQGALVAQGVSVGPRAKVGVGSVVVQSVAAGAAVFGVPAAPLGN